MTAKLIFLAVLVHASTAFFFDRGTPVVTATRPVNESCLALAEQGSCAFYTCFEQRFPCGREWYVLKHGRYYCERMVADRSRFTETGQHFIDTAKQCMTESLRGLYAADSVDCHDLEHDAVEAITPCFTENGFCQILETDAEEFFRIYEFGDLFTRGAGKLWRAILRMGTDCGSQYIRQFSSGASETILNGFNSLFESIASIGDKKK